MDVKPSRKQLPALNNSKFTAVKIDLTRLTTRRRCQAIVISDKTTGLEIKSTVIEKIGMDQRQIPLMELIMNGWKSLVDKNYDPNAINERKVIADQDCPLVMCEVNTEKIPRLHLIWKEDEDLCKIQQMNEIKLNRARNMLENQIRSKLGSDTLSGYRNGSTLPGHGSKELRFPDPGLRNDCGSSSYTAPIDECLIHYEPYADTSEKDAVETCQDINSHDSRSFSSTSNDSVLSGVIQNGNSNCFAGKIFRDSGNDRQSEASAFRSFCPANVRKHSSVESLVVTEQRETKFSSLPNMEQLEGNTKERPLTGTTASTSLPCISASNNLTAGKSVRRFLPDVSIPEEIMEEKRHLLSKQLEKKLKVASIKRRQHSTVKRFPGHVKEHRKNGKRISRNGDIGKRTSGHDSDGCVSVTSLEVAEIMAEAGPMVPVDSDYEDPSMSHGSESDNIQNIHKFSSHFQTIQLGSFVDSDSEDTLDGSSDYDTNESALQTGRKKNTMSSRIKNNSLILPAKQNGELEKQLSASSSHHNSGKSHHHKHSHQQQISPSSSHRLNSHRRIQDSSTERKLTLFKLLRTGLFQLCSVLLRGSHVFKKRLPFEIFNDVIYLDKIPKHGNKDGILKEKFTVLVVGDITDSISLQSVEGNIEVGDVLIEVNGTQVLNQSAADLARIFGDDNCSRYLQIAVARPIFTSKTEDL